MTGAARRPPPGILVTSSALPVAPSAVSAAIRSDSSVFSVRTGPSWPWNTPMTRASAAVVVGADWLVSKVTVILLIVGHLPVFQPGPDEDLLRLPQRASRLRTNRDVGSSLRLHACSRPRGNLVKKRLSAAVSELARPVEVPDGRRVAADWPWRPAVVIAASAVLALALRLFQL